jgi:hypothetical protein
VKAGGAALVANDITTTAIACAIYDLASTQWELQDPQTAGSGTSAAPAIQLTIGVCSNASFQKVSWSNHGGGQWAGQCRDATTNNLPVMFWQNGTASAVNDPAYAVFVWPSGTVNSIGMSSTYASGGSGGNIELDVSLGCLANGSGTNAFPGFNTAVTQTVVSSDALTHAITWSNLTFTGCSAGLPAYIKFNRNQSVSGNSVDPIYVFTTVLSFT